MENFIEYMWYLLTTPYKKIRKSVNKWYVLCEVFGKRFDAIKEDILRARDEGMLATCCNEMLPIHGNDRNLIRYEGEHPENFRSRIAMYERVCMLGGTNEGIILAIKALGFDKVELKTAKELYGDTERWAEFYVIISMLLETEYPISIKLLKKEVRKIKEVGAKDNYLIKAYGEIITREDFNYLRVIICFKMRWYGNILWDGSAIWNGEYNWKESQENHPMKTIIHIKHIADINHEVGLTQKYHYRTWNGMTLWNGAKNWDAEKVKEVL